MSNKNKSKEFIKNAKLYMKLVHDEIFETYSKKNGKGITTKILK